MLVIIVKIKYEGEVLCINVNIFDFVLRNMWIGYWIGCGRKFVIYLG